MSLKREAKLAQAVAEATRLQILHRLMEGPAAVAELVAELDKPQSLVSNHLGVLRDADLVQFEREGRKSLYRLANASVATLVESLAALSRTRGESRPTPSLASARTCYDHLAGSIAVDLYEWLIQSEALRVDGEDLVRIVPFGFCFLSHGLFLRSQRCQVCVGTRASVFHRS